MHATIRLEGTSGHVNDPGSIVNPITTLMHILRTAQGRFETLQITSFDARSNGNNVTAGAASARIYVAVDGQPDALIRVGLINIIDQAQKEFPGKIVVTY